MEIQEWKKRLDPYSQAVDELLVKFKHITREYKLRNEHSCIEQVDGRVKKISSIIDKANRKNIKLEEVEDYIEDIAGIRIICQFVEDIYRVVELIKRRDDLIIKEEKDYVKHPKESGYRSYHIIIYYNVVGIDGSKKIHVEIQIRTLAMNFWAIIEHSLQYKYNKEIPKQITNKLFNAAESVYWLDYEMSEIRNEIVDAQKCFKLKSDIVQEVLNDLENLYNIANKNEVLWIQQEFYKIYREGKMNELLDFKAYLDKIASEYKIQSYEYN